MRRFFSGSADCQVVGMKKPISWKPWAGALLLMQGLSAAAQDGEGLRWGAFVQAGVSEDAQQLSVGLQLPWATHWRVGQGDLSGYWDFSLSRWKYPAESDRRRGLLSQIGATPTLRWSPGGAFGRTFLELGVGATLMSDLYRTNGKRFSTRFNFGSHIGVGWPLDDRGAQELIVRVEHFSNAGIRHPNPGEDFLQVRYAHRF